MANIFSIPLNSQVLVFEGISQEAAEKISKLVVEFAYTSTGSNKVLAIILNDDHTINHRLVAFTDTLERMKENGSADRIGKILSQ